MGLLTFRNIPLKYFVFYLVVFNAGLVLLTCMDIVLKSFMDFILAACNAKWVLLTCMGIIL